MLWFVISIAFDFDSLFLMFSDIEWWWLLFVKMDTDEYIEDIDDDGLDELLEDQSDEDEKLDDLLNVDGEQQQEDLKSEDDSKSRVSQDDDDFSNDNVLIHRQDPEEKTSLSAKYTWKTPFKGLRCKWP